MFALLFNVFCLRLASSQDPREYLPFLRELRALEKYYQRFRIDDHLGRYGKALQSLRLAGMAIQGTGSGVTQFPYCRSGPFR